MPEGIELYQALGSPQDDAVLDQAASDRRRVVRVAVFCVVEGMIYKAV